MQQYNGIKQKYPDAMLLFRVGDFYETFGKDAVNCAKTLNITLTKRGNGSESETALAGFPHHAVNTYLPKLVKAGFRVAICDQLEPPNPNKKIVKRGVTELITPGVTMNEGVLESKNNNFLAALHQNKNLFGVSFLDISTGEFLLAEGEDSYIQSLLEKCKPQEILIEKRTQNAYEKMIKNTANCFELEDWVFGKDFATEKLLAHFKVENLKGFGVDENSKGVICAGAILHYLSEVQQHRLGHIVKIQTIFSEDYLQMDAFTIKNLELYTKNTPQSICLLEVIDKTCSPMGGRMLKNWLCFPLKNIQKIQKRQKIVSALIKNDNIFQVIKNQIEHISDIERLAARLATEKIYPKALVALKNSLKAVVFIKEKLGHQKNESLKKFSKEILDANLVIQKIEKTLFENAPVNIQKTNAIAKGVDENLDTLRNILHSGKDFIEKLSEQEKEKTGIPSLKIAFNQVFGYYLEVKNTHKNKVPEHWIRKQTLVSAERYITQELKNYENKILGAEEKIQELELKIYKALLKDLQPFIPLLKTNAKIIAKLDCLCSFSILAMEENYVCPEINDTKNLEIKQGRHPVIEKKLPIGESYIPNDVVLDKKSQQIMMITGPNMSGKSAILRQTALIVLLGQMGCFVPAASAKIGLMDRIFTRVGASDNISMGESTFMVEMNETASILNNITQRSLVLLDEIGRGTSTYDGISIAWAIAAYLHTHKAHPLTLFATHYHELNEMEKQYSKIQNYNVSVQQNNENVLFLRTLVKGASNHSFGIHVAKLAGIPFEVLQQAKQILKTFQQKNALKKPQTQLTFFEAEDLKLLKIKKQLENLEIDSLTPLQALHILNQMKKRT